MWGRAGQRSQYQRFDDPRGRQMYLDRFRKHFAQLVGVNLDGGEKPVCRTILLLMQTDKQVLHVDVALMRSRDHVAGSA